MHGLQCTWALPACAVATGAKGYANRLGMRALPALRARLAFEPTLIRAALVAVAIAATNHALTEIDVSQVDAR